MAQGKTLKIASWRHIRNRAFSSRHKNPGENSRTYTNETQKNLKSTREKFENINGKIIQGWW